MGQYRQLRRLWIRSSILFLLTLVFVLGSELSWPVIAQTLPQALFLTRASEPNSEPNNVPATKQFSPTPGAGAPEAEPNFSPPIVQPLQDIQSHWARDCIQGLVDQNRMGNFQTYPDGLFLPEAPVTWRELVTWLNPGGLLQAAKAEDALGLNNPSNFLSYYPSSYFELDRAITRVEAINAIAAHQDFPYANDAIGLLKANFSDAATIPEFAREGVAASLTRSALALNLTASALTPNAPVTRGEVAALICRANPAAALQNALPAESIFTAAAAEPLTLPPSELRGVWLTNIDSEVLFSRDNLTRGINTLKDANFNTVYPTIWNWGTTLYPSQVAERTFGVEKGLYPYPEDSQRDRTLEATQGDRDMLQELIEIGHAQDIKVIPWFEFGFMIPADSTLVQRHPDWLTYKADGTHATPAGDFVRAWLNPFHPQVQRFFLLMVDELLQTYDIDGFQVDDHMGIPVEFGYDATTIALYQREHNGNAPPENARNREWMRWRANKISDFIGEIAQLIKSRRPDAIFSVSPNPYPFSYDYYLQDWPTWVNLGYVDELIVQLYRSDMDRFIWEMNRPALQSARRRIPTSIGVLTGLRTRPMAIETVQQQIAAVRDRAYAGVSFFFFESIFNFNAEPAETRLTALKAAFVDAAAVPERQNGWRARNPL